MNPNDISNEPLCPVCGSHSFKPIPFYAPELATVVRRSSGYHWRLCMVCGNGFPSSQATLAELQEYWNRNRVESEDMPITDDIWEKRFATSRTMAQWTYDFVAPFIRPEQRYFLDVGCGLGATVALFQERGWVAEGVDPDPNTRCFYERMKIRVVTGQIENVSIGSKFDVISIAHAIYFITEPRFFVQRVRGMLSDGGLFHVVISNFLSSFSNNSPGYSHSWYPTVYSLAYLLEQEGFEILTTRRFKGSVMLLARSGRQVLPHGQPRRAYWAHLTLRWRYRWFGKPIRSVVSLLKRIRHGR